MNENDAERTVMTVADEVTQVAVESEATAYGANVDCPVCRTANPPSERYCIDCGFLLSSEPVAVEEVPEVSADIRLVTPDGTREFVLRPGENTVGRENADILLPHNTVSRSHAKVIVEDGCVYVEDSGSTNGTTVDGRKIDPGERIELANGAEIVFGNAAVRLEIPESEEATELEQEASAEEVVETPETEPVEELSEAEEPSELEEPELPAAGMLVSKDGSLSFPLVEGVSKIGRREGDNDIVIPDSYCSGRHADLEAGDGAFTITDIGSTNGTFVSGEKIEPNQGREVAPGDEITIGRTVMTIEVPGDEHG